MASEDELLKTLTNLQKRITDLELVNDYNLKLSRVTNCLGKLQLLLDNLKNTTYGKSKEIIYLHEASEMNMNYLLKILLPEFEEVQNNIKNDIKVNKIEDVVNVQRKSNFIGIPAPEKKE